jgi:ribosome-binding factor A
VSASPRMRKVDDTVREALSAVLLEDIQDPRLELVTVTSVEVSHDKRHARVYVTTHGDVERYKAMLTGLESAKRRLRAGLARRVSMKFIPELNFYLDSSIDEGMRISEAIRDEIAANRPTGDEDGDTES